MPNFAYCPHCNTTVQVPRFMTSGPCQCPAAREAYKKEKNAKLTEREREWEEYRQRRGY